LEERGESILPQFSKRDSDQERYVPRKGIPMLIRLRFDEIGRR